MARRASAFMPPIIVSSWALTGCFSTVFSRLPPGALLPNLAGPDMLIIFMIVLIMFGAKKLPELAKGLGQAVREFSKAKDDIHGELNRTTQALEVAPTTHPYPDPHHAAPIAPAAGETAVHSVPAPAHSVPAPGAPAPVPSATAAQNAPGVS